MASKHYHIKFNFDHDKEIIDRIESKENKNDYIRRLIQTDILADSLQGAFRIEERDPNDLNRIDWYNDHCPAINNLDPSVNHCDGCEYRFHFKDVDGIEKAGCNLEDAWRTHCSHVIDNMLEDKSNGEHL